MNWWKCYQLNKQNKVALPAVGTIHPSLLQEGEAAVLLFVALLSGRLVLRGLESAEQNASSFLKRHWLGLGNC